MDRELRINPGLVCIERSDGYFVGHLNDQLLFPNVNLTSLLRKLQTWQPYKTLKDIAVTHQIGSEDSVNKLLEQLDAKGFLEWRSVEIQQPEIFISHMNEIGLALAPILFQDGFAVETFDQRRVRFSDVRGSFVRVANHGEKFDSVLNSQVREIINSGHSIHSAEYSLGRNSGATNYQSADKNSHKPLKDQQEQKKFVVVTAYPEPELLASLMEGEIPHLFIFSVPGGAFIGPLVRPGKNPCFHCIELQRSDNDRNWQNVALTLFSDRLLNPPMAATLFAAAIAAKGVAAIVRNEKRVEHLSRTTIFRIPDLASHSEIEIGEESHTWNFHPSCSCHWGGALSTRGR